MARFYDRGGYVVLLPDVRRGRWVLVLRQERGWVPPLRPTLGRGEVDMRRLLVVLSLAALLGAVVAASAQSAKPGVIATKVNFGKVQSLVTYSSSFTITNNTNEAIDAALPSDIPPLVSLTDGWVCGHVDAKSTCTQTVGFYLDMMSLSTYRWSDSATLNYVGADSAAAYPVVVTFSATIASAR